MDIGTVKYYSEGSLLRFMMVLLGLMQTDLQTEKFDLDSLLDGNCSFNLSHFCASSVIVFTLTVVEHCECVHTSKYFKLCFQTFKIFYQLSTLFCYTFLKISSLFHINSQNLKNKNMKNTNKMNQNHFAALS